MRYYLSHICYYFYLQIYLKDSIFLKNQWNWFRKKWIRKCI